MQCLTLFFQAAKDHLLLAALFGLLLTAAFFVQEYCGTYGASLGPNLISEFIGAAVTVYGIDYLIRRSEKKRLLPVKAASYEDVRIITHWALNLWKTAYEKSVGDAAPSSWHQLLSDEYIQRVMLVLDVTKPANIVPTAPWGNFIDVEMQRIHQRAEKILERHAFALDPEIHRAVYSVVYHKHHSIVGIQQYDRMKGIHRPTNLGSYMPIIREWFDSIVDLHEWTVKTHKYLCDNGVTRIHAPFVFAPTIVTAIPDAKIDAHIAGGD